jgi:hypothetical protein
MNIMNFGRHTGFVRTKGLKERIREAEHRDEQEESVFSDNPDWYLRMVEDQRKGFADYE